MTKKHYTDEEKEQHELHERILASVGLTDEELAYCAEYERVKDQYVRLYRENREGEKKMAEEYGAVMDPARKFRLWAQYMITELLPEDTIRRLEAEIDFENFLAREMAQAIGDLKLAKKQAENPQRKPGSKLMLPEQPPTSPGGIIVPGRGG